LNLWIAIPVRSYISCLLIRSRNAGIEVSDIGGNPVSVFVEDHTQYMVGERLIIYGYVRTSKTGIGIRASGLFKA